MITLINLQPLTRLPKTKISRERAGHWVIERQRRRASVWPRWSAAHLIGVQQLGGGRVLRKGWGVESRRTRWVVKMARRRAPFHVTDWTLWGPVILRDGITPRGMRRLSGTLLAVGEAVGSWSRKWRGCLLTNYGGWDRAGGGHVAVGRWVWGDRHRAGAAITAQSWLSCSDGGAGQLRGLRPLSGDHSAGLQKQIYHKSKLHKPMNQ